MLGGIIGGPSGSIAAAAPGGAARGTHPAEQGRGNPHEGIALLGDREKNLELIMKDGRLGELYEMCKAVLDSKLQS